MVASTLHIFFYSCFFYTFFLKKILVAVLFGTGMFQEKSRVGSTRASAGGQSRPSGKFAFWALVNLKCYPPH